MQQAVQDSVGRYLSAVSLPKKRLDFAWPWQGKADREPGGFGDGVMVLGAYTASTSNDENEQCREKFDRGIHTRSSTSQSEHDPAAAAADSSNGDGDARRAADGSGGSGSGSLWEECGAGQNLVSTRDRYACRHRVRTGRTADGTRACVCKTVKLFFLSF